MTRPSRVVSLEMGVGELEGGGGGGDGTPALSGNYGALGVGGGN
jgi:hypothetical protein